MTVVLLSPDPATSTENTEVVTAEEIIVKRSLKPTPVILGQEHQVQTTGIKRKLKLFSNQVNVEAITEKAIMRLVYNLQPLNQSEVISASGTSLILTIPPAKPTGSIALVTGEILSGQRLRSGDFHSLKIYIRGNRLDLFKIFFRFKPINNKNFIIKKRSSGLVNFIPGVDTTTNEESLTITALIYQTELIVDSDKEFIYELECDDLLGFKVGIIDSGSFTVYPDLI